MHYDNDNFLKRVEKLYTLKQLDGALYKMARLIEVDYVEKKPLVIGVMNGALVTLGHLLPKLAFQLDVDYLHATRYGESISGGELNWLAYPRFSVKDRHVLLVDDIFDEGLTLKLISQYCVDAGAVDVKTAVLLDKKHNRKVNNFCIDYFALSIPDRYVFGFGLDYQGAYRNLAGIFSL